MKNLQIKQLFCTGRQNRIGGGGIVNLGKKLGKRFNSLIKFLALKMTANTIIILLDFIIK